jgi:hypothetical protein
VEIASIASVPLCVYSAQLLCWIHMLCAFNRPQERYSQYVLLFSSFAGFVAR